MENNLIFSDAHFGDYFQMEDGSKLLFWKVEHLFGLDKDGSPMKHYILINDKRVFAYDKYGHFISNKYDENETFSNIICKL